MLPRLHFKMKPKFFIELVVGAAAVITAMNTNDVTLRNLAVDASNNTVSGCAVTLSGIHYYNASGTIDGVATAGTRLADPSTCSKLFPGNGFGVLADQSASPGSYEIQVRSASIHEFTRNGILVMGAGEHATVEGNMITGIGPASGGNQFGVFLANGATGRVEGNSISQRTCGAIAPSDCVPLRSEGVVLRSVGSGVVAEANIITNVQAGVFVNGAPSPIVQWNSISNVNGIHIQGSTGGTYVGNRIMHVGPISTYSSQNGEGCGLDDVPGLSSSGDTPSSAIGSTMHIAASSTSRATRSRETSSSTPSMT